ncbi:carboxylate-amine ligase [Cellulomonas triticagri]|uniref:carboxylate-amine ligase n=1 Tax=Cellulomonas triticagri TaxID=2483352 RepID=UPI0026D91857
MRTIGVEEEFLLVDEEGAPRAVAAAVLQHASAQDGDDDPDRPGGALEKEFAEEQVETSTHPCTDLGDLLEQVRAGRWQADASARHAGARVAALATSPRTADPTVVLNRRAQDIAAVFAQTARDQLTSGCHVHVEVADDDEGVRVVDHLRRWNPVLLALSANSPFWHDEDSGYASFRSQIWGRWPTAGPTAPFGDAATYRETVDGLVASGTILDAGMVYFDARLSVRYPTVEVRVGDVCLDPADAVLLGALVRALAETALGPDTDLGPQPRTEALRVATWRAARSGLDGDLVSPLDGRPVPAGEAVAALVRHVTPALAAAGDLAWVHEHLAALLARGNGASQQRRWRHEGLGTADLVRRAVERTHA